MLRERVKFLSSVGPNLIVSLKTECCYKNNKVILKIINKQIYFSFSVCSLTANGIFALFGTHSIDTLRTLKTYINRLHMPYITTSQPMVTPDQMLGYELYMLPDYTKALLDLITHYHWKRIHYVYDSNEGMLTSLYYSH